MTRPTYLTDAVARRMERLAARLQLSLVETDVLGALVAVATAADAIAYAQTLQHEPVRDGLRTQALAKWLGCAGQPDVQLVHALSTDGGLQRWALVECIDSATAFGFERWIASRAVVAYALGSPGTSAELAALGGGLRYANEPAGDLDADTASEVRRVLECGGSLRLVGSDRDELSAATCKTIASVARRAMHVAMPMRPTITARDAVLCGTPILIELGDRVAHDDAVALRRLVELAKAASLPVIIVARTPQYAAGIASTDRFVAPPSAMVRRALWEAAFLRRGLCASASTLHDAADTFGIGRQAIEKVASQLAASRDHDTITSTAIGTAVASQVAETVSMLGELEPLDTKELHAPARTLEELAQLEARCRHRRRVFDDPTLRRSVAGGGVVALLYGARASGKTHAARLVATRMGWRLLRIDMQRLFVRWNSELGDALRDALEAAEDGRIALLFDHAEALLDPFAQPSASAGAIAQALRLLEQLERFDGVAFLATRTRPPEQLRGRFTCCIELPSPDEMTRRTIWQSTVPPRLTLRDHVLARLARVELSAHAIKTIVVRAAFMAARDERELAVDDLFRSLAQEIASPHERPDPVELARTAHD